MLLSSQIDGLELWGKTHDHSHKYSHSKYHWHLHILYQLSRYRVSWSLYSLRGHGYLPIRVRTFPTKSVPDLQPILKRFTFGKPLAWAAMIVRSPAFGFRLSRGIYCFIARCRTSSWEFAKARAYSRMCWHSEICSLIWKTDDIVMAALLTRFCVQGTYDREKDGSLRLILHVRTGLLDNIQWKKCWSFKWSLTVLWLFKASRWSRGQLQVLRLQDEDINQHPWHFEIYLRFHQWDLIRVLEIRYMLQCSNALNHRHVRL